VTGLLGRLAAQAVGVQPLVRPRPRSRFEPEPGASGPGDIVELEQEVVAASPPAAQRPPEPSAAQAPPPAAARRRGQGPPERAARDALVGLRPSDRMIEVVTELVAAPAPEPALPHGRRGADPSGGDPRPDPAAPPAAAAIERVEQITTTGAQHAGEPVAGARAAAAAPDRGAADFERGLLSPPVEAFVPAHAASPRPAVVRREERAPEPAPAPEIHVTIGRIEVRAPARPPSPAPAPAGPASSPGLGLGDYLRQRAEGSRR
jgi:hypothetical protein